MHVRRGQFITHIIIPRNPSPFSILAYSSTCFIAKTHKLYSTKQNNKKKGCYKVRFCDVFRTHFNADRLLCHVPSPKLYEVRKILQGFSFITFLPMNRSTQNFVYLQFSSIPTTYPNFSSIGRMESRVEDENRQEDRSLSTILIRCSILSRMFLIPFFRFFHSVSLVFAVRHSSSHTE